MDLEQFFQENPDWDDGWPNCQQGEEAVEDEDQVGGAQIDITDHIEVTAAGEFENISPVTRRVQILAWGIRIGLRLFNLQQNLS